MELSQINRSRVNGDIIAVLWAAKNIGWNSLSEQSVYRIIYLSSVLYSFRFPSDRNPFKEDYHFSVDALGPYSSGIRMSLLFLETNSFIEKPNSTENSISLGSNFTPEEMSKLPDFALKYEWLCNVVYLLGVYGEGRIYEFVIRDPEYRNSLQNNSIQALDIGVDNDTIQYLLSFKSQFELALGADAKEIDSREYLELYFEYIFSKILKRTT